DPQCGGDLTQSNGEFSSPNYPNNYLNNAACTWRIQSPEYQVILLTFTLA
ncbi:deleted in malignant brain tumors 1 protein-like, partial [Clarias magur]